MIAKLRARENFHIVLWLFKDLCWVSDFKLMGTIMIVPTLAVAAWLAWQCRRERDELLHSLAVVFWIMANSTWMIGEFFFDDHSRGYALVFFFLGLGCVAWYYLVVRPFWVVDARPTENPKA